MVLCLGLLCCADFVVVGFAGCFGFCGLVGVRLVVGGLVICRFGGSVLNGLRRGGVCGEFGLGSEFGGIGGLLGILHLFPLGGFAGCLAWVWVVGICGGLLRCGCGLLMILVLGWLRAWGWLW